MNGGRSEREGDTESKSGSRLRALSTEPDAGLELTDCKIMTGTEVRCPTHEATQAPLKNFFWLTKMCLKGRESVLSIVPPALLSVQDRKSVV